MFTCFFSTVIYVFKNETILAYIFEQFKRLNLAISMKNVSQSETECKVVFDYKVVVSTIGITLYNKMTLIEALK